MVLWCRSCNALLGLREPLTNWSTDRSGICASCLEKQIDVSQLDPLSDTAEDARLPPEITSQE
jgi:hypothetical protein